MKKDKRLIPLLSLATVFFLTFSVSAFVFIKANGLAFVKDMEEYERKVKIVDQAEEKIADLEEQVERYKKLYENAIKDNKRLASDTVKTQAKVTPEVKAEEETKENEITEETINEEPVLDETEEIISEEIKDEA
jgi:hypothetical protein